ncbi:rhombosortase [Alloalcanivorax profundimaris]|uniref:rhombosortase n=1 Tax=Alloalcanivorax profundimaris TaxID=2735259 RepID=UPI001888D974|nr:rhombosortase [Alloalcanivorax profundimaris]MBF1800786.1 rhombosortase [Alloalcanivorax profundimaris]
MKARDPKLFIHAAAFAALVLILGLAHAWVNATLRYDRAALEAGQIWRLFSAHLVHLNHWHTLMNLAGLGLILFFFRDLLDRRRFWLWFLVSAPLVSLAMFVLDPGLDWYVGLSGLLQGLLVYCLVIGWRGNPVLHSVVLALVVGRLIWEQMPGYDLDYLRAWIHGRVYVNAHLYGALAGALLAVAQGLAARFGRPAIQPRA